MASVESQSHLLIPSKEAAFEFRSARESESLQHRRTNTENDVVAIHEGHFDKQAVKQFIC